MGVLDQTNWREAVGRWKQAHPERMRVLEHVSEGRQADTASRQVAAAQRTSVLAAKRATDTAALRGHMASTPTDLLNERVIGRPDFVSSSFLEVGLASGMPVCRVETYNRLGSIASYGTGFMVSPRVLLTNNHVIPGADKLASTKVSFNYQLDRNGQQLATTTFDLDTDFFVTDVGRDCSLVAIGQRRSGPAALADFGWLPLNGAEGKVKLGDSVSIIQHPQGQWKQWVISNNLLLALPQLAGLKDPNTFAHYETDTLPGSSGSPVFSPLWEVVALHHQGVPDVDATGQVLGLDGKPYFGSDDTKIKWIGNEGIRVTALVRFLQSARASRQGLEAELIDEVLQARECDVVTLALKAQLASGIVAGSGESAARASPGKIEFILPLRVTFELGPASTGSVKLPGVDTADGGSFLRTEPPRVATAPAPHARLSEDLEQLRREALQELENNQTRKYFDAALDTQDAESYYSGLALGNEKQDNFAKLSERVIATHAQMPRYRPAKHVYPWVDVHRSGNQLVIRSIYSGRQFDARQFIEMELQTLAERATLRERLLAETASGRPAMADDLLEARLESQAPYNCEHVVPQSWFGAKEPMRGDLHHLFACESKCNSFRNNHAYFDFPPEEASMDECGRQMPSQFEPVQGKGAVARATLYFLLRYPKAIDPATSGMDADRVSTLVNWHRGDPPALYERHRNQAIFGGQGNRNPFIDFPQWADEVDFALGL